jgi:hypothetical protein
MRAEWTDHDLIVNAPLDWMFDAAEQRLIRRGLEDREKLQADNVEEQALNPPAT